MIQRRKELHRIVKEMDMDLLEKWFSHIYRNARTENLNQSKEINKGEFVIQVT